MKRTFHVSLQFDPAEWKSWEDKSFMTAIALGNWSVRVRFEPPDPEGRTTGTLDFLIEGPHTEALANGDPLDLYQGAKRVAQAVILRSSGKLKLKS